MLAEYRIHGHVRRGATKKLKDCMKMKQRPVSFMRWLASRSTSSYMNNNFKACYSSEVSLDRLKVTELEESSYVNPSIVDHMYDKSVSYLKSLEKTALSELALLRQQMADEGLTMDQREVLKEKERQLSFQIWTRYNPQTAYQYHIKKGRKIEFIYLLIYLLL